MSFITTLGMFAREYERRGGRVVRLGKPEAVTYDEASRLAGIADRSRLLAVCLRPALRPFLR